MASRYWVGGTDTWDSTAGTKWALTSGGAGGAPLPSTADDVFFDASSGAITCTISNTFTLDVNSLDFTGFTGTIDNSGGEAMEIENSPLTLGAGMSFIKGGNFTLLGTCNVTTNGVSSLTLNVNTTSSVVTLQDNYNAGTADITVTAGTFNANGFNTTCRNFSISGATTRTVTLGSGTHIINGGGGWNAATTTNLTFNANTSTILLNSSTTTSFNGGGKAYSTVQYSGTGTLTVTGSNTYSTFSVSGTGATVSFTAGTTQTVATFTCTGTSGHLKTLQSTSSGTAWNLSKSSGTVNCNFISLKDSHASGGAVFNAGISSVNVSGNTGWSFLIFYERLMALPPHINIASRVVGYGVMGIKSS